MAPTIERCPVDVHNWGACADLAVALEQRHFVCPAARLSPGDR